MSNSISSLRRALRRPGGRESWSYLPLYRLALVRRLAVFHHRQAPKVVIEDMNRYSEKPIVLADESVGNLLLSGAVVFEGQVTDWLRALAITLPVVVVVLEGDDRIVICVHKRSEVAYVQPD
jgi:hypothetical protein